MPFDGTPIIHPAKSPGGTEPNLAEVGFCQFTPSFRPRPMPLRHVSRAPERVGNTLAVLAFARDLVGDEQRWCKGAFARSWWNVPVRMRSGMARRYCALGAIMRAGYELRLRIDDAHAALEWQLNAQVQNWNDDPARTHSEVMTAFDAAIAAVAAN